MLNVRREAIGNHRLKSIEKFLEPHGQRRADLGLKTKDIERKRPVKVDLSYNSIRDEQFNDLHLILPKNLIDVNLSSNKLGPKTAERIAS